MYGSSANLLLEAWANTSGSCLTSSLIVLRCSVLCFSFLYYFLFLFSLFSSLRDTFCLSHLPRELKQKTLKIKSPATYNTKQNNKTRQRSRQGHFQNYVTLTSASNSRLIQGSTSPWLMYPTSCVPHTFEKVEKKHFRKIIENVLENLHELHRHINLIRGQK